MAAVPCSLFWLPGPRHLTESDFHAQAFAWVGQGQHHKEQHVLPAADADSVEQKQSDKPGNGAHSTWGRHHFRLVQHLNPACRPVWQLESRSSFAIRFALQGLGNHQNISNVPEDAEDAVEDIERLLEEPLVEEDDPAVAWRPRQHQKLPADEVLEMNLKILYDPVLQAPKLWLQLHRRTGDFANLLWIGDGSALPWSQ